MRIYGFVPAGYEGFVVAVEVDLRRGIPATTIVGLAGGAVREARERVRAAIRNSGFHYPDGRVLINLAPADIPKGGAAFDLAIAVAILQKSKQLADSTVASIMIYGELMLDGQVRRTAGVLSAMAAANRRNIAAALVPNDNVPEALALQRPVVVGVSSLNTAAEALAHFSQAAAHDAAKGAAIAHKPPELPDTISSENDFGYLQGQPLVRRALEIAAAGGHHALMVGSPGSGKTMAAHCFSTILPNLERAESLEVTRIHSRAGLHRGRLIWRPPFRSPHHSASLSGMLGGGERLLPGEVALAHCGVLLLDEVFEFRKDVLQALREPIEDGSVRIVRAERNYHYPARFQLIMAANPCPCGNLGSQQHQCLCSMEEIGRYWKRLGGPLLDRIDIRIPMESDLSALFTSAPGENSAQIRQRVADARARQRARYSDEPMPIYSNARLSIPHIERYCALSIQLKSILERAALSLQLSVRALHAVRRVARTIADLEGCDQIERLHLLEAIQHRRHDRQSYQ